MKCANVYFCCLGFIRGYLKSSENKKKVGFKENECLIFIKLAVGLTFCSCEGKCVNSKLPMSQVFS